MICVLMLTLEEDEIGAVYNLPSAQFSSQFGKLWGLDDVVPSGVVLAVKEPYCELHT